MHKKSFITFFVVSVLGGVVAATAINSIVYLNAERRLQIYGDDRVEQLWWGWNAPWSVEFRNGIGWERYDWQNRRSLRFQSIDNPTRAEFDELVTMLKSGVDSVEYMFPEQSIWSDWMVFQRVIVQERRDPKFVADSSLDNLGKGRVVQGLEIAVGWPFYAIYGGRYVDHVVQSGRFSVDNVAMNRAVTVDAKSLMPYGVFWLGAVGNVLAFSILVGTVPVIFERIRRNLRMRRGLCGRCGYLIQELKVCPECGGKKVGP